MFWLLLRGGRAEQASQGWRDHSNKEMHFGYSPGSWLPHLFPLRGHLFECHVAIPRITRSIAALLKKLKRPLGWIAGDQLGGRIGPIGRRHGRDRQFHPFAAGNVALHFIWNLHRYHGSEHGKFDGG